MLRFAIVLGRNVSGTKGSAAVGSGCNCRGRELSIAESICLRWRPWTLAGSQWSRGLYQVHRRRLELDLTAWLPSVTPPGSVLRYLKFFNERPYGLKSRNGASSLKRFAWIFKFGCFSSCDLKLGLMLMVGHRG